MLKRIFLSLMAVVLVVGLLPTVALADESDNLDNGTEDVAAVETSVVNNAATSSESTGNTALSATPLATEDIASGTLGTCTWVIDSDGCLTIAPEDGVSGEFSITNYGSGSSWPWYSYRTEITSATTESGVSASGSLSSMLSGATYLEEVDFSLLDVSNVTSISSMFYNCTFLKSINLSGWDVSNITSMSSLFSGISFLESVDLSGWNTSNVNSLRYAFNNCSSLTSVNLSGWDTSNVTDMSSMFNSCSSLVSIDLSYLDTSSVEDMSSMFDRCSSLTFVDMSGWDTSNVTDMSNMFYGCSALTSLDLTGLDTSHVSKMSYMFESCTSLTSLELTGLDVSRVTSMSDIFRSCSSLVALDLSDWNTSHLIYADFMFYSCPSLTYLNLSSFDMSYVTSTGFMFDGCTGLRTVVVGDKFAFVGSNYLPTPKKDGESGKWMSDDGTVYDKPSELPNNVATTYTAVFPHHMSIYAGSDRYSTSQRITRAIADESGYGSYEGVIVCSAQNGKFADALCAAGLSGLLGYPIVLVNGSYEPAPSSGGVGNRDSDIDSFYGIDYLIGDEGDIIILGGESTVNDYVTRQVIHYDSDGDVTRIAGDDRYATAEAVYEYGEAHGGWATDYAVLAKGNDFPDALGAASFCTANAAPMLLTDQNDASLPSYVLDAAAQASEVVIVGGTSSVSTAKENTLRNYATVERFGEATRYETNLAFARWQLNHGMSIDNAGIATGINFPDALGSSYLLSLTSSVLLLTSKTESENAALYDLLADNAQTISSISVFGGDASVSDDTRSAIQTAISGDWQTVNK